MNPLTKDEQAKITPADALSILKQGNERFVNNQRIRRDLLQEVAATANGPFPFATILSCIDSRTSSELIFDQGMGGIFNVRIAGNIVNPDILGSMEFSCKIAGSKLILVLGHTGCVAIKGACAHSEMGNLTGLLEKIKPAINRETTISENRDETNNEFVDAVAKANVYQSMVEIRTNSPVLMEMINRGDISLVGGLYDVSTGKVTIFD